MRTKKSFMQRLLAAVATAAVFVGVATSRCMVSPVARRKTSSSVGWLIVRPRSGIAGLVESAHDLRHLVRGDG